MTYTEALTNYNRKRAEYNHAIAHGYSPKEIARLSGRMIASLQALRSAAVKEGKSTSSIDVNLRNSLNQHKTHLNHLNYSNKNGPNYSVVRELSTGFRSLINAVKSRRAAITDTQKRTANQDIKESVATNLKNIVKAPLAITTKILKNGIVATVLFAPVSLGLGILHAAWECMDKEKSPYEGKTVKKLSAGFTKVMGKLHNQVQRI